MGAEAGPFDRTTLRYAYPLPEEVVAIQGPTEEDIEFSIYLTLPHLPEEPGIEGVPLAILFHAFNNPSIDSYTDLDRSSLCERNGRSLHPVSNGCPS